MKILLALLLTFQMSGVDRPKEPFLYGLEYFVASYSLCKKTCAQEGVYFISYAIYQDHRKSCLSNGSGSVSIDVNYIDQGKRVKLVGNGLRAIANQEQNTISGNWLIHKDAGRSVDLSTTFTGNYILATHA